MRSALWINVSAIFTAIVALCGLIWVVSPLLAVAGVYPFENPIIRLISITFCVVMGVGYLLYYVVQRFRSERNLAKGINGSGTAGASGGGVVEDDGAVLRERMKDALVTLKNASGGKSGYLYDLPWYVIIGPPGAGKTTALINSGLNFPLTKGRTPEKIAGVGGTRYCDWWFTEEAVMIDTAGRYTTQDSNAAADQKSWLSFLGLIKKNRPRQPINGVIIAISIQDIIALDQAELVMHAGAIRSRLLELHDRLKIDFPVYVIFTKMDLVAGFIEFFGHFGEMQRRMVWGTTFQNVKKTENLILKVPEEFDAVVERMTEFVTDRLQGENDPTGRLRLFGFPAQMATLKQPVFDFLSRIFEPTRYHANATLRGFYFVSGTQQGTPIDRIIGSISRTFGAQALGDAYMSGAGRSYFLSDLLKKVVFAESAWVSTDRGAVRRRFVLLSIGYVLLLVLTVGGVAVWTNSYAKNDQLIAGTTLSVANYKKLAGSLLDETQVSDNKYERVVPLLEELRRSPVGYDHRDDATPLQEQFGLEQRPRIVTGEQTAYHAALERFLRPRLLFRLESLIADAQAQTVNSDKSGLYEAFKVYLMLGGYAPVMDRQLILDWERADWAKTLYVGPENEGFRRGLDDHLNALMDLDTGTGPKVELNGKLIAQVQDTLVRLNVADRAYQILKSRARSAKTRDWTLDRAGSNMATVFESSDRKGVDSISVPAFFTYGGFYEGLIDRLPDIASQLERDRWVLGEAGKQTVVASQFDSLPDDILRLYAKDFIAFWDDALGRITIKSLTADRPRYLTLVTLSASASPLKQLFEDIRTQTQLTRERPAPDPKQTPPTSQAPKAAVVTNSGKSVAEEVEAHFRPYYVMVDGAVGSRPVDKLVNTMNDIYQGLLGAANQGGSGQTINSQTVVAIRSMRATANSFPQPFDRLLRNASDEFEGNVASSIVGDLQKSLSENVVAACKQAVPGRYPFTKGSDREIPLVEFARLFGPNGVFDKFTNDTLWQYIDKSKADWTWQKDDKVGSTLAPKALADFQRARQIRDAFFGSGPQPGFALTVTAMTPTAAGTTLRLNINGTDIPSPQNAAPPPIIQGTPLPGQPQPPQPPHPPVAPTARPGAPVVAQWPGAPGYGRAAVTVTSDLDGTPYPPVIEKTGTWALFRLLDQVQVSRESERLLVRIPVYGREFSYQMSVASLSNPLTLRALRDFNCPTTLQ